MKRLQWEKCGGCIVITEGITVYRLESRGDYPQYRADNELTLARLVEVVEGRTEK